jgi:hypothetical protein
MSHHHLAIRYNSSHPLPLIMAAEYARFGLQRFQAKWVPVGEENASENISVAVQKFSFLLRTTPEDKKRPLKFYQPRSIRRDSNDDRQSKGQTYFLFSDPGLWKWGKNYMTKLHRVVWITSES